jgi:hypothetical protein
MEWTVTGNGRERDDQKAKGAAVKDMVGLQALGLSCGVVGRRERRSGWTPEARVDI